MEAEETVPERLQRLEVRCSSPLRKTAIGDKAFQVQEQRVLQGDRLLGLQCSPGGVSIHENELQILQRGTPPPGSRRPPKGMQEKEARVYRGGKLY